MMQIRKANERGHVNFGWLDSNHTFSFGNYYDPAHMGYGPLRVINEDRVQPGEGFPTHGHENMEIISYVLDGALEHRDSIGTGSVIRPNEVQRMSAGTGIRHSEYNPSPDEPVHFLQIWLIPDTQDIEPGYEQKAFPREDRWSRLRLVASPDGRDGSLTVHVDAELHAALLDEGASVVHELRAGRRAWVQVARGTVEIDGQALAPGDGAAVEGRKSLRIDATADAEILLFDMS